MRHLTKLMFALCTAALLAGCGGGGSTTSNDISTTTTGQQLMDLKKALDSGAMSQSEYEKQRKKVLDKD